VECVPSASFFNVFSYCGNSDVPFRIFRPARTLFFPRLSASQVSATLMRAPRPSIKPTESLSREFSLPKSFSPPSPQSQNTSLVTDPPPRVKSVFLLTCFSPPESDPLPFLYSLLKSPLIITDVVLFPGVPQRPIPVRALDTPSHLPTTFAHGPSPPFFPPSRAFQGPRQAWFNSPVIGVAGLQATPL